MSAARRLFRHPRIHTGVIGAAPVTGLLVEGESIVAVGDADRLREDAIGASLEVVDLPGECVVPGFYDAHLHSSYLARSLDTVDLSECRSLDEALDLVAAQARTLAPGQWLTGGRWDANRWQPREAPNRQALDRVSPEQPVVLESIDGHSSWVSSRALELAGITAATTDPAGGTIERGPDGSPTGILREQATELVGRHVTLDEDLPAMLDRVLEHYLSLGVTSVHDLDGEDARAAFLELQARGRLRVRIHKAVRAPELEIALAEGRRTGDGDDWFRMGPVKIFSDGALGSHTCHMTRDFAGDPGNHGIAVTDRAQILDLARRAVRAGIAVATHAIGDRANETVLDVYEELLRAGDVPAGADGRPLRLRVEHAQYVRPADVARYARLGVVASMQPTHCTSDWDLADELLAGHDLAAYAWASMLRAGAPLAFGSDAPVESANPFEGLHAAVTRQRADGRPVGGWRPQERVGQAQALSAYTLGSAYAAGEDARKGTLEAGKLADLVAVDTDLLGAGAAADAEPMLLHEARALVTVVGGRVAFAR